MKTATISFLLLAFVSLGYSQSTAHADSKIKKIIVLEVLQTSSYTYLYVLENESKIWMAVPSIDAKVNDVYYYKGGIEMWEFKSTELDRVFPSIWFVQGVFDESVIKEDASEGKENLKNNVPVVIEPVEGGITIAEVLLNKDKYVGKTVTLKGRVSKFNSKIMGTNWIHLEDGSSTTGGSEITITSDAKTKMGDIIIIKGTVVLDKDFGAGYFYEIILENGEIVE